MYGVFELLKKSMASQNYLYPRFTTFTSTVKSIMEDNLMQKTLKGALMKMNDCLASMK